MRPRLTFKKITIICLLAIIAFWYAGHRPIAYHNSQLGDSIGHATRLELSLVPTYWHDPSRIESNPKVVISDRAEIDKILHLFRIPWHQRASNQFHMCCGHFIVRVIAHDSMEYQIQIQESYSTPIVVGQKTHKVETQQPLLKAVFT
jgi:hypothetical protein